MMTLHKDKYGIIGQIQADGSIEGGDSACWMGHYIYLSGENFDYVSAFEARFGGYVRHPDPEQTNNGFGAHYKNPWNGCISRDQLTGVIGALIARKERLALLRLILHHAAWLFLFSYNTIENGTAPSKDKWKWPDLTFANIWGMYLRGFGKLSWIFWPLLVIFDLHLLIDTIFTNVQDDDDQINYTLRMIVAKDHVPTPTGWLARKILNKGKLLSLLKKYWCGWRDNCGMYYLYIDKVRDL